jgi:hypothetical protein
MQTGLPTRHTFGRLRGPAFARRAVIAAAAITGFCAGAGALAGPVVTAWHYSVDAVFDTSSVEFTGPGGCPSARATAISWGACNSPGYPAPVDTGNLFSNRSAIRIDGHPASGLVLTNGAPAPVNTYSHDNNDIFGGYASLRTAAVQATLSPSPLAPSTAGDFGPAAVPYAIHFLETPNEGDCLVASVLPCDDIFVIAGPLANSFVLDDNRYTLRFFELGQALNTLPDAACLAAGVATGCQGFTTPEGSTSAFTFGLQITSEPASVDLPEPSGPGLVGIGLLLVGVSRRWFGRPGTAVLNDARWPVLRESPGNVFAHQRAVVPGALA